MNRRMNFWKQRGARTLAPVLALLLAGLVLWLLAARTEAGWRLVEGTPSSYLPALKNGPVPTATPVPQEPQFVKNVPLPNAQCPNEVGFNAISGYVYVTNSYSFNVSVFKARNFITDIVVGEWPSAVAADNDSSLTYITVMHEKVTVLDGTTIVGKVPDYYEPYGVAVNPVNGYAYVTDLDSTVQIINGTTLLANVYVTDPDGVPPGNGAGWLEPVVVDRNTGLVYVASWSHGKMYVFNGTEVVADYRPGWGVKEMAIDSDRGTIYLAHSDPNATYTNNISVYDIPTKTITRIDTDGSRLNGSRAVAVDPVTGYAYFTNPDDDTVTVMAGTQVLATLPAGDMPWDVGVNPNTGYVFVTNREGNSITVLKGVNVVKTIAALGQHPFAVGVDTNNNDVYIANRGNEVGLFQCNAASVTILH